MCVSKCFLLIFLNMHAFSLILKIIKINKISLVYYIINIFKTCFKKINEYKKDTFDFFNITIYFIHIQNMVLVQILLDPIMRFKDHNNLNPSN